MIRGILLCLLIAGCATIDKSSRPIDFPTLNVLTPIYADLDVVNERCLNQYAIACARIEFDKNECQIYYSHGSDSPWVVQEEELHCQGYDHPNDSLIADAWEQYKQWRKANESK